MTNQQIILNNLLVQYFKIENAGEKCLLFLHGWRSNKEVWSDSIRPLISSSANKQISFYSIDLPGFGGSQIPKEAMTVGDYAQVGKEFIIKMGLKNVIIVGHSFGGRVGIKLASTNPELISGLVLVDSAGFAINESKKNIMAMAAKIVKPLFKPGFMQPLRKKIYQKIGAEDYVATPALQKTFVNIVSEDLTEDLKKISCKTLIINGENDKETPVEFGQKMHSLIPNSRFVIIKDAGHFAFLDKQEEFVKELEKFLN